MSENELRPRLRFKGYTDAWELHRLGDLATTTYGGGTPSTSNPDFWNGSIPWIQSSNILEHELFDVKIPKTITTQGLNHSAALLVPKDSIAVVTHVGVGKLAYLPFSYATSQDFTSLSQLKSDPAYLCYAIYKKLQSDINVVQGSAIKGITKNELLDKQIFVPSINEQKDIGKYLRNLDSLLTLHQRKCEKLQAMKKALLEKMFPGDGENTPKIRFKGYTDAWELHRFGDIIKAESVDICENPAENGKYPVIQQGNDPISGYCDEKPHYNFENLILFGDHTLSLFKPKTPFLVASDGVKAYFFENTNGNFALYLLENNLPNNEGYKRYSSILKSMDIYTTYNLEEQKKIGELFDDLDSLLTLHQRKRLIMFIQSTKS